MTTANRKPHSTVAGYVCELKARLGGHVVVLDRERGADDIDADYRWIVMHLPSSLHVAVRSQGQARDVMKGVARAASIDEACEHADILPRPASGAFAVDDDGAEETVRNEKRLKGKAWDEQSRAALERFQADPENEPSAEGKAALRTAFGLDKAGKQP